jgi:hypothetical protein
LLKTNSGFDDFPKFSKSENGKHERSVGMIPGAGKALKDVEIEDDACILKQ